VRKRVTVIVLVLITMAQVAAGADVGSPWAACYERAGNVYNINPDILYAISGHESNHNPRAVHFNTNGTYDFGLMQINSIHAKELGPSRWAALGDPCTNIMTGAWILSQCISRRGYTWDAIGCYNSGNKRLGDRYSQMVYKELRKGSLYAVGGPIIQASAAGAARGGGQGIFSPWEKISTLKNIEESAE
jgi:soluble lytic murein transglycosylase-like protein